MSDKTRLSARWRSIAADWHHRLCVTLTRRTDPRSRSIRARTLAVVLAIGFALLGVVRELPLVSFFIQPPFDLDWALRTVSLGWYEPNDALPVTIVDIDEATYRGWESPAITPRGELARLIEVVSAAEPSAVVVDIDLSGRMGDAPPDDERRLAAFLAAYRGAAPLIFPKRMEPGDHDARQAAASLYDALFLRHAKLQWAHASFVTDGDGSVRHWMEWLAVCSNGKPFWLPAVPILVLNALADVRPAVHRVMEPSEARDCLTGSANERRLLVGPRLTGRSGKPLARDARTVSAALVLDPDIARDDRRLFSGRVVLIGATHSGSGDFWLTPGGVLPGVELLANTVHYAPLDPALGAGSEIAYRALAIVLFAIFVAASWWLRGIVAFFAGVVAALLVVAIAISGWDYFRVFESLESAIWLTVLYVAVRALLDLKEDFNWRWKSFSPDRSRFWRTLRAVCVQDDE
jgi:adenylate cyclase